jgi:peptide deformylase|tara:strand:- start:216 stop:758 length:543 start_codon:yes stop_codon:yes gene_type:complete
MGIKNIIVWPDDILEEVSSEVEDFESAKVVVDDLIDTMEAYMGVGLSAPQLGVSKRIIVIDKNTGNELEDHLVMINPVVIDGLGETVSQEGCLSFPGHTFYVPRCTNLIVKYLDKDFVENEKVFEGFLSIAIQHEIDHLDGITLVENVNREKRRSIKKSLKSFKKRYAEKTENWDPGISR